ncbi:MAG: adenosylhomocysteinase [Fibrobacter sp.]|jgi:adenosylhomocysteinase|nr:adenosylhomocysteinase [Fibrobacter sp.]
MFESEIQKYYAPAEYPALEGQFETWAHTRPFRNTKVLDAAPVFRNTLVKYRALLAGGAHLSVGVSDDFPCDEKTVSFLKEHEIPLVHPGETEKSFDVILDCAGRFSHFNSRYGFVELTRSGVSRYEKSASPVWIADSGVIKQIETSLGTGDGFFRAMKETGFSDWEGKRLAVIGSGKVGSGIFWEGIRAGARVSVATDTRFGVPETLASNAEKVLDIRETAAVCALFLNADVIVTATGVKNALAVPEISEALLESAAILANMGVEDEFGAGIPDSRVLNQKKPLNFILEEPTHLKYIEATMALHNALGETLLCGNVPPGIHEPPETLERELLKITHAKGTISAQIEKIIPFSYF